MKSQQDDVDFGEMMDAELLDAVEQVYCLIYVIINVSFIT